MNDGYRADWLRGDEVTTSDSTESWPGIVGQLAARVGVAVDEVAMALTPAVKAAIEEARRRQVLNEIATYGAAVWTDQLLRQRAAIAADMDRRRTHALGTDAMETLG